MKRLEFLNCNCKSIDIYQHICMLPTKQHRLAIKDWEIYLFLGKTPARVQSGIPVQIALFGSNLAPNQQNSNRRWMTLLDLEYRGKKKLIYHQTKSVFGQSMCWNGKTALANDGLIEQHRGWTAAPWPDGGHQQSCWIVDDASGRRCGRMARLDGARRRAPPRDARLRLETPGGWAGTSVSLRGDRRSCWMATNRGWGMAMAATQ